MTSIYRNSKSNINNAIVTLTLLLLFSITTFSQTDTVQTDVPPLKEVFQNDFYIGCLLSYPHIGLPDDPYVPGQSNVVAPNGGYLIQFHMNNMSPGNNMKPENTVDIWGSASAYNSATPAERDSINVNPIVRFNGNMIAQLNWAKRQGFTFRGHTLVWHNQTPAAFFRNGYSSNGSRLSKEKMIERMDNYIKEVVRILNENWPGMVTAMDVVNEAVNDNGTDRTNSEWYLTFGDDSYIMKAFEITRKHVIAFGETQMKLYYNDYNTHLPAKADAIVRVCQPIYKAGYLDGIGMQEHNSLNTPSAQQWIDSYNKFEPICDEMAVTELDVTTGSANPSQSVLNQQANQYGQLFKCFVERSYLSGRGKIIYVSKDGLNDRWTFKQNQSSSLWDENNQCKPSFYAVVDVGINYNSLDSLIQYADLLMEDEYTPESWLDFENALSAAYTVMNQNFSYTTSAAEALIIARENLEEAIENLEESTTSIDDQEEVIAKDYQLLNNYPNPFNPTTTISFVLPHRSQVRIVLVNSIGAEVLNIANGTFDAGIHYIKLNAAGLASGIYFYRMETGDFIATKKLVLTK